tara:strand:+ start:2768 stop:5839 length:3072 start_codon:yes stop_codon:yes gene_type:complete
MANFNKSFNFRNGVQVDDDNFIVNPNGQVGIGSTVPTEFFDLHGNAVITGATATGSISAGVGTVGVLTATTAGVGTLAVDEIQIDGLSLRTIVGYHTTGWNIDYAYGGDENPGGYGAGSGISTTIKCGIGTTQAIGKYDLLVGGDPAYGRFNGGGLAVAYGSIHAAGIITASQHFVGVGSLITQLDADGIAYGTINDARLPDTITSDLIGDVTGTATTASSLSGHPAIAVTSIVATGVITSTSLDINGTADMTSAQIGALTVAGASILYGPISGDQINLNSAVTGVSTVSSRLHLSGSANLGIGSEIPGKTVDIIRDNASVNIEAPTSAARLFLVSDNADANVNIVSLTNANVDIASSANTNINIDSIGDTNVDIGSTGNTSFDIDSTNLSFDIDSSEGMSVDIDTVGSTSIDISSSNSSSIDLISGVGTANVYINSSDNTASVAIGADNDATLTVDSYAAGASVAIGASGAANFDLHSDNDLVNVDITSLTAATLDLTSTNSTAAASVTGQDDVSLTVRSTANDQTATFRGNLTSNLNLTSDSSTASLSVTGNNAASLNVNSGIDSASIDVEGQTAASARVHSNASTADFNVTGYGNVGVDVRSTTGNVIIDANASGIASAILRSQSSTTDLDIVANNRANLDIVSLNNDARIRLSNYIGVADTSAFIQFGANPGFLDIINNDTGGIRFVIDNSPAGVDTGSFKFVYGAPGNASLMNLTYDARLGVGIGITNPTETLQVGGGLTVSTTSYFAGGMSVKGNITAEDGSFVGDGSQLTSIEEAFPPSFDNIPINNGTGNAGVSTFRTLLIFDTDAGMPDPYASPLKYQVGIASVGIGTDNPQIDIDAPGAITNVAGVAVGKTANSYVKEGQIQLDCHGIAQFDKIAIGDTHTSYGLDLKQQVINIRNNSSLFLEDTFIALGLNPTPGNESGGHVSFTNQSTIVYNEDANDNILTGGIGRALVDYGNVGSASSLGAIILPNVTTSERNGIKNYVSSGSTVAGSIIFNTTTNKFQGYTGSAWVDLH